MNSLRFTAIFGGVINFRNLLSFPRFRNESVHTEWWITGWYRQCCIELLKKGTKDAGSEYHFVDWDTLLAEGNTNDVNMRKLQNIRKCTNYTEVTRGELVHGLMCRLVHNRLMHRL